MTVIHIDIEARRRAAERIVAEVTARLRCSDDERTARKMSIIDAYSAGDISESQAMAMIRVYELKDA